MAPTAGRRSHDRTARGGALAQLGERVVRNDGGGGSTPPGSTTLRLRLRVAQPRKPKAKRARRSPLRRRRAGDAGQIFLTDHYSQRLCISRLRVAQPRKPKAKPSRRSPLGRRRASAPKILHCHFNAPLTSP